jgi:hypothetical protein
MSSIFRNIAKHTFKNKCIRRKMLTLLESIVLKNEKIYFLALGLKSGNSYHYLIIGISSILVV